MHTASSHSLIKFLILLGIVLFGISIASAKTVPASAVRNCDRSNAPIINVTQKVVHTVDSGQAGNNWAFDDLNRQMKVYDNGDGTFCVESTNEGKFDSQGGQRSPGNTGVLTGNEDGTFKGGYQAVITGTLLEEPLWPTNGNVGTTDYQCDINGNCPGYISWPGQYFAPGFGFAYDFWGWAYKYQNCVWVNASTGNQGDILCGASGGGVAPGDPN